MTAQPPLQISRQRHVITKLRRSREHYVALRTEVDAFLATEPYSTSIERNRLGGGVLRLVARADPPVRWGAIVGDVVHNLRASLDVAVYQLVEHHGGVPNKQTAFPMADSADLYPARAELTTKGLHPEARSTIDRLRPYVGGTEALAQLHKLDIEDKHHLLLALAAGGDQGMSVGPPSGPRPDGLYVQGIKVFGRAHSKHLFPLFDGASLLRADSTGGADLFQHFHFFPFIAMKADGWEIHEDVFEVLDGLGSATQDAINELLRYFGHQYGRPD